MTPRPHGPHPVARRVVASLLVGAIVVDVVYWTLWFTDRASVASRRTDAYYQFENAFPLADFWLAVSCAFALVALVRRMPSALFWLVAAGSAGTYLGAMDLLYDLERGIFADGAGGTIELTIVVLTWAFSATVLIWSWRHRGELAR